MAQIISIQPTIENCDPVSKYQKSTPGEYSFQENPILYGGGRKWTLKASNTDAFKYIALAHQKPIDVDLFVLNTSLIVWLNDYNKGVEIPYPAIQSHSIQKNTLGVSGVSLTVENTGLFESACDQITELFLIPMYGEYERYYNESIEQLFTFEYFGINKGDKMVMNTFYSIGKCSNFHLIPSIEPNEEDEYEQVGPDLDIYEDGYDNSGNADDIDMSYQISNEDDVIYGHAGIDVKIITDNHRGVTRTRDDAGADFGSSQERNESPKRIRC